MKTVAVNPYSSSALEALGHMPKVALGAQGALRLEVLKASQGFGILVAPNLKIVQLPLYEKTMNRSIIKVNNIKCA